MAEGQHLQYNQILYHLGSLQTGEQLDCTSFPTWVRVLNPTQNWGVSLTSLEVWHQEEPSEHLALKATGAWVQEFYRTRGNRDSPLGGCTQSFLCTGALGRTYLWVLEDLLERWRLALAHSAGKDTGGRNLREYPLAWTLPKVAILAWRPSPTYLTARKLQCWDTSGQTTNGMGTQPNSSADRLPEAILIPQPPLNSL